MSEFNVLIDDVCFALKHSARIGDLAALPDFEHLDPEMLRDLLTEAGRFMAEVISPLNRVGDEQGATLDNGTVILPDGYSKAYDEMIEAGWNRVAAPEELGGAALPFCVQTAVIEMLGAANMAFSICTGLSDGATHAISDHASEDLKQVFLEKMVHGSWTGSMDLTEPQAGSDLGRLRCQAERQEDGTYHIKGTKIFISWGDHTLTENVIHLVLARTPDAPAGSRGISLFIVPKYLVEADGSIGQENGVRTVSLEHKMGIRVSPTCVLSYGETTPSVGYLIGEENLGLLYMFTMMNRERIFVGNQGLAIAERAYQQALEFARERVQGRAVGVDSSSSPGPGQDSSISEHPDVRRMLITMKAKIEAMRGLLYAVAADEDLSSAHPDAETRTQAGNRMALVTPVVKAWLTDTGVEITSLAIQVHGGVGYVEETGVAQHYRDARIAPIYEGTNGIQAMDLAMRKLRLEEGRTVAEYLAGLRAIASDVEGTPKLADLAPGLNAGIDALAEATEWLQLRIGAEPRDVAAGATPYIQLFGTIAGACSLAQLAVAATQEGPGEWSESFLQSRTTLARFFIRQLVPPAIGLVSAVTSGAENLFELDPSAL
ncbi:MAG: acyl-CoA dehydrogenase [Deltaproteobacteria bacterium]|nr:acyl-CoA dehydrogenase [Deltaproteobacteria bacterium]